MLNEERKKELLRDYENPDITVGEMAAKYHLSRNMVSRIAVEQGAQPRREKTFGKARRCKGRVCPKCKKLIDIQGAKFCYCCGADIRNSTDRIIEENERLLQRVCELPDCLRDDFRNVLLANINELKETQTTK